MKTNFLSRNTLPRGSCVFLNLLIMILLSITQLSAQNSNYTLPLKTGNKIINENIQDAGLVENILTKQLFDSKSYVLLQFYQLPDTVMHKKIQNLGVDLTQYVAANTYRAVVTEGVNVASLSGLNVRAVDQLTAIEKIEPLLLLDSLPEYVAVVPGKLDVQLKFERNTAVEAVIKALQAFQVEYLEEAQENYNYLQIRVLKEELESIADMPFVDYVYPVEEDTEFLGSGASRGSVIRSEYVNNVYGLKGDGVVSGIFEASTVAQISHIDLRGNVSPITLTPTCSYLDGHGTIVSGMAGGQGVLRPTFQGVAPQMSMLYLSGNSAAILTELNNYSSSNIPPLDRMVLMNQSFVGGNRSTVDQYLIDYPETMHVTAAGNAGVYPTPGVTGPAIPRYFTLGMADYPYAGIDNPTETAMAAKNITTVGAIDMYGRIIDGRKNGSSKGPTWDGRVKPEVVAIGGSTVASTGITPLGSAFTTTPQIIIGDGDGDGDEEVIGCNPDEYGGVSFGTSFAAPQVVGGLGLLYEYYRNNSSNFNFNTTTSPFEYPDLKAAVPNPTGALMKAIACNSADDLGNPGPDFVYGFGKMNLRKAIKVLENEQFINHRLLAGGGSNSFSIDIPSNMDVYQLKVMLYWPDPAIAPMIGYDTPNLIHDIDLELEELSTQTTYLPLVLNPVDEQSATLNATPQIDNLNNVEQIVITANSGSTLAAGTYIAHINMPDDGLTTPNQPYYLVWEFVEPGITITNPSPNELIANGGVTNYYVEWDYNGGDDDAVNDFEITITDDNGYQHTAIVDGDLRVYRWPLCSQLDINSSNVTVKVERLGTNYSDETTFSVYNGVDHRTLKANYLCDDKVCLSWNVQCGDVNGVPPSYFTIYRYDDTALDMIQLPNTPTTTDYFATVDFDNTKTEEWYAVSASYVKADGSVVETERCNAIRFVVPASTTTCSGTETCPTSTDCVNQLTITQSYVPGDYNVSNYIKTDDTQGASVIVNTGEHLELSGANRVRLHSGLKVKSDATFRADNEDCSQ